MQSSWLVGWKVVRLESPKTPIQVYLFKCKALINFGRQLFDFGVLPELDSLNDENLLGTSGNFAIRDPFIPGCFLITACGVHKGRLGQKDFVIVYYVDWDQKKIFINSPHDSIYPSTDTLLVASAFEADLKIKVWIHIHRSIDTVNKIRINYPALTKDDLSDFSQLVKNGAREINLIDHDFINKSGKPNNIPDSAIILGKKLEDTFERTIRFLSLGLNKNPLRRK